eukprot:COSAG02_NODE_2321_length_9138_cov_11.428366_6_plen_97_part_00
MRIPDCVDRFTMALLSCTIMPQLLPNQGFKAAPRTTSILAAAAIFRDSECRQRVERHASSAHLVALSEVGVSSVGGMLVTCANNTKCSLYLSVVCG